MSARVLLPALVALAAAAGCAHSPQAAPPPDASGARTATPTTSTGRDSAAARDGAATRDTVAAPSLRRAAVADTVGFPTRPPELPEPKPLTVPPVVERTLPNGLRLLVVEHHELPVADLVLVVRTGAEADPADRTGLATLTASLFDEGAGGRDALAIADQEAYLGVDLSTGSGWDLSSVSLHAPTARLDSALALFADVALRPTFPAKELERLRAERLTQLVQLRDRGPAIADRVFPAAVFGDEHPYGRPLTGTEATTRAITGADVRGFYERYYRPNNAVLIVVGDVQPDDVARRVGALFGDWERRDVPAVTAAAAPSAGPTRIILVDKPGAAQSSVRIGGIGVARSTRDYFPLLVMNTVLGGSFTSRLNQNLRETHGYTYGAGSSFSMRRMPGPFTARGEIVAAKTDSALIEFMRELRAIRDTVPQDELQKTKRYLQLQLPGDFETTGDIANQLVPIALYDLPLDYYDHYSAGIAAVTQADVQRVARQYIDPSHLAIVVVGDRASVEPTLRATGIGELVRQPLPKE
ncbi:MAG TPA: pitrilysin family protein [Gemmatimonadaceae bacterium]|nr:pitrilysin family protein [Gemmatimonadaceae bacterium]